METTYKVRPWKTQDGIVRSSAWKLFFYRLARPWLSIWMERYLSKDTLKKFQPSWVLPERGFPLETRRRWASNDQSLHGKTVLVQGTGTGWDVITWAALRPGLIYATDLFAFEESWAEIKKYYLERFGVEVVFRQAGLEDHSFLPDKSIDLCASDAVYEHCKEMRQVMQESFRILKDTGSIYAAYGPMWFCASGDHFNRGGLENAFSHLLLIAEDYQAYYRKYRKAEEDFQSGGRYIELGLFSYLTTSEYLEIFKDAGFCKEAIILEISPQALNFSRQYPAKFAELEQKYQGKCTPDDFLIKANFVRLRKRTNHTNQEHRG